MLEAIDLAKHGMNSDEGGPFGSVIVKDNKVVGRGYNKVTSINDPTAHAEVTAIREACLLFNTFQLENCEIYTSCEPCPMCLGAIYWAKISKIYFACTRADAGAIGFSDQFIYQEIPKGLHERSISIEQALREEAMQVFNEWNKKPGRFTY